MRSTTCHRAVVLTVLLVLATAGSVRTSAQDKAESPGTGVRTLYLVRHGAYDYEDERDPAVGKALTPLGVAQARLTAARLRALPVEVDAIYSSSLTRARETAFVIAEDFPGRKVEQTDLLVECQPPSVNEEVDARGSAEELETCRAQLAKAMERFFVSASEGDRHEILVAHGNVIRYLAASLLGVDPRAWINMRIGNCSLTIVQVGPDGTRLIALGDIGHIPANLQTGIDSELRPLVVTEPRR